MSFTSEQKNEMIEKDIGEVCCEKACLAGMILFSSAVKEDYLKVTTENRAVARKIVRLLKKCYGIQAGIEVKGGGGVRKNDSFTVSVVDYKKLFEEMEIPTDEEPIFPIKMLEKDCCKRAFVKGAFLGGGNVSAPLKRYHLEFVSRYEKVAKGLTELLLSLEFKANTVLRQGKFVTYVKEFESICDILTTVGATKGVMSIYEAKVIRDKKNELNRLNNYEVANICKTATAAAEQIKCIEKIRDGTGLSSLPESLEKLARARLEHPEIGLAALGEMMNPPIGKSGVNHRMRKIMEISKRY